MTGVNVAAIAYQVRACGTDAELLAVLAPVCDAIAPRVWVSLLGPARLLAVHRDGSAMVRLDDGQALCARLGAWWRAS